MALTLATLKPFPFPLYLSISKNFEGDKGLPGSRSDQKMDER